MKNTIIFDNKIDFKQGETLTFFLNENLDFKAKSKTFSVQILNKIQVYLKHLKFKKVPYWSLRVSNFGKQWKNLMYREVCFE